jgi:isopenicillin N synthase-like dioxygenase
MAKIQIPVIDIEAFRLDGSQASIVPRQVRKACETVGFMVVTGHGVPESVTDELMDQARHFFDQTPDAKSKIRPRGTNFGGPCYVPLGTESLAATLGHEGLVDSKECIDAGPRFQGDHWPREWSELELAWHAAFAAFCDLAAVLRALFAEAMGLPRDSFETAFERHCSSMRVLNYPEIVTPLMSGQVRAGIHTDYGAFTILRGDDTPGLQVLAREGTAIDPPVIPGTFIVNIGDALMRWTNDHWISTPHRVICLEKCGVYSRRQSIAFFHNPSPDAVIECLTPFLPKEGYGSYPPITYHDYAEKRFQQSRHSNAPLVIDASS